jgi:hypothetical protein
MLIAAYFISEIAEKIIIAEEKMEMIGTTSSAISLPKSGVGSM